MTEPGPAPTFKMYAIFLSTLIFANVFAAVIESFLPKMEMPNTLGVIFLMVASAAAGGAFANATRRRMTAGEKLRFALVATTLALALSVAIIWGILAYFGIPFTAQNAIYAMAGESVSDEEIRQMLPIVVAIVFVVGALIAFLGVGLGASSQVKQLEKLAAKGR